MKKVFAFFTVVFSFVLLLMSCSTKGGDPTCTLTVSSTADSINYSVTFDALKKTQSNYKIEVSKGTSVVKSEVFATTITSGSFKGLEMDTAYKVSVSVTNKESYDLTLATKDITTEKGILEGVSFKDASFIYDGTAKSLSVLGLPEGAEVNYTGNAQMNVGEYEVTATIAKTHYKDLVLKAKLKIVPADTDFILEDKEVIYNGTEQTLTAKTDLELTYKYYVKGETTALASAPVHAGVYTVEAIYAGDNNHNPKSKTATLTIKKATYDMGGVSFVNQTVTYDGSEKTIAVTGTLPSGVSVTYTNHKLTNVGSTTATASFKGDSINYEAIPDMTAVLTIEKASVTISADPIVVMQGTDYDVEYTCSLAEAEITIQYKKNGEVLSAKPTEAGSYIAILTFAGNENYASATKQVDITINNPAYQNVTIFLDSISVVYGENYEVNPTADHGVTIDDLTIIYEDKENNRNHEKPVNAGVYTIIITFEKDDEKFLNAARISVELTIQKAEVDFTFADGSVGYDGQSHSLVSDSNLNLIYKYYTSENVELTSAPVNAGTYKITATYAGDENHHAKMKTATLVILQAEPDVTKLPKTFTADYEAGMTVNAFKDKLDQNNYTFANYDFVLNPNQNKITVTYTPNDSNYYSVEIEITLTCTPAVVGFEVVDTGRQIKGMPFDENSVLVKYVKSDGSYEIIKSATGSSKSYFTVSTTATDTTNPFSVTVEITDSGYKLEAKKKTLTITPVDKPEVMIYALYGAGGSALDSYFKNDFIILYNATDHDIDLTGWSVQYASATSDKNVGTANIVLLEGIIKAYSFYTILAKSDGTYGADLPFAETPNTKCELAIAQANAKVFLSTTTTAINAGNYASSSCVDVLGTGTATNVEGSAAPAMSKTTFVRRNSFKDQNDNSLDFTLVDCDDSLTLEFLNENIAYNYAKTILDHSTLDFDNLPDTFELPASYNGTNIIWTWNSLVENITIDGGVITIDKSINGKGDLIGTIDGKERFKYNIIISNKTILSAPSNVKLDHLTLTWDVVDHANAYQIYVDGASYISVYDRTYTFDPSSEQFKNVFNSARIYDIQVKAVPADIETYEESKLSSAMVLNLYDTNQIESLKKGTVITMKGVVTAKASNNNEFYLVDANSGQGLLIFKKEAESISFDTIAVGNVLYVTGLYTLFNDLPELQTVSGFTVINETIDLDPITDIRNLTMKDIGHIVDITPSSSLAIVMDIQSGNILVSIDGIQYQLRGDSRYLDDSTIVTLNNLIKTNKLKFKGIVSKYYENYQIYVTEVQDVDTSVEDSYKLEIALEEALNEIVTSGKQGDSKQLITLKAYYGADISFSYRSSNSSVVIDAGSVMTFGTVEEETEVEITVTAQLGMNTVQGTKKVLVKVPSAGGESVTTKYDLVTNFTTYASGWNSSYLDRPVIASTSFGEYDVQSNVKFTGASKPNSNSTLTGMPIMGGKAANTSTPCVIYSEVELTTSGQKITYFNFEIVQWNTDVFADIHLQYYDASTQEWKDCSKVLTSVFANTKEKYILESNISLADNVTKVRLYVQNNATSNKRVGVSSITLVTKAA